jgi:hypothetical protein
MHGIFLFSMIGERRRECADRRGLPRGGRRCSDKVRLALLAAICAVIAPAPQY